VVTQTLMENFLDPVFRTTQDNLAKRQFLTIPPEEHVPWGAYLQAWLIAITGGGTAFFLYMRYFPSKKGQPLPGALELARKASWNKFWVDEGYTIAIIRPISISARVLWRVVDSILIDGVAVRGTAWVTARTGAVLRYLQTGDAQAYAAIMALGLAGALVWILQRYAL
ncbi:MAG TPA: hypothetical protein PK858_11780, partial [Saprospiraceae bacterium]|nr:hypothetical protein [Saprospiraceae bacterium]